MAEVNLAHLVVGPWKYECFSKSQFGSFGSQLEVNSAHLEVNSAHRKSIRLIVHSPALVSKDLRTELAGGAAGALAKDSRTELAGGACRGLTEGFAN